MDTRETNFTSKVGHSTLGVCQTAQAGKISTKSQPVSLLSSQANRLTARIPPLSRSVGWVGLKAALQGPKSSPKNNAARLPAKRPKRAGKRKRLPETLSSVPYWGMLVHPKDGHQKVFCVLHAYLDESGTHDSSPLCVIAGYFGSERHWNKFDLKWRKVLDSEGIEEFHANRFWSFVGGANISEYRGWDKGRCNAFLRALLNVIWESHRIFPVCCTVVMADWHALSKDERAYLTGASFDSTGELLKPGAPNKPYFLPFLTVISIVMGYCNPGHRTHFSFDQSKSFSGYALQYFREIKGWGADRGNELLEHYGRIGEIFFPDSKDATPIQAADLLAFETYQYGIERLRAGNLVIDPRPALHTAISNMRNLSNDSKMFDPTGFQLMLATYRTYQKKA